MQGKRRVPALPGLFAAGALATALFICFSGVFLQKKEEAPPEASPVSQVLYYKGQRIGAVDPELEVTQLCSQALRYLGDNYALQGDVELRQEEGQEPTLAYDDCVQALEIAVQKDHTVAYGVSIGDEPIARVDTEENAYAGVEAFLRDYAQEKNETRTARLKELTIQRLIVPKSEVIGAEELQSLLHACADGNALPAIRPVFVLQREERETVVFPYEEIVQADPGAYIGQTTVASEGAEGKEERVYLVTEEDGEIVSRKLVSTTTLVEKQDRVILAGTLARGEATGSFLWTTTQGHISSAFGYRTLFGEYKLHAGIDVAVPTGTALYAGDGGTVVYAGNSGGGYGIYVMIDHGNGFETIYAHMSRVTVKVGDKVNKGEPIGYSGATGRVTGPHVHYEFRYEGEPVNPKKYLPAR